MPTALEEAAAVAFNGDLLVLGGYDGAGHYLNTVEAYNPSTNTWAQRPPMPTARCCLGAAAVNGVLYAIGGFSSTGGLLSTVEAYKP